MIKSLRGDSAYEAWDLRCRRLHSLGETKALFVFWKLAAAGGTATYSQLRQATGATKVPLSKVMRRLSEAGLATSTKGPGRQKTAHMETRALRDLIGLLVRMDQSARILTASMNA